MQIDNEPAFVLHARPWRETSLLVEVLTRAHGRLGLVARGVQGPKKQPLRAALQPLQAIVVSAVLRGELAQLRQAEAVDVAPRLVGDCMLAGFYVNELLLRLAPRHDPLPELHALYAQLRARLPERAGLAWTLRRFERDLLEILGVGLDLEHDVDGAPLDPAARYLLEPEAGPRRLLIDRGAAERRGAATGRALLALARDQQPEAEDMTGLRLGLRALLLHQLGGRGLHAWDMREELVRRPGD